MCLGQALDLADKLQAAAKKWGGGGAGTGERREHLSQVEVVTQRTSRLKKRALLLSSLLIPAWCAWAFTVLQTQVRLWETSGTLALTGPDGSAVIPLLFSGWYLVGVFFGMRSMAGRDAVDNIVFEFMVLYNLLQAGLNAYVGVSVLQEVLALGYTFAGNAPSQDSAHRPLGQMVILHYLLRLLELMDTFFLVLRKKTGASLRIHTLLRLQNVWGWHLVARFGCGGDAYFPVLVSAITATQLHLHYAATVLEPSAWSCTATTTNAARLRWPVTVIRSLQYRREVVTALHVSSYVANFLFGLLSLYAGAYPRWLVLLHVPHMLVCLALYSNFHHETHRPKTPATATERADGSVTFSFDSSGWCYFYHFGVAIWLQENFAAEIAAGKIHVSGSSGGSLAAVGVVCDGDIRNAAEVLLTEVYPVAHARPWLLRDFVPYVLRKCLPPDAHKGCSHRLRVLLTRVFSSPPFFMGEVATEFEDRDHLIRCLCASSHVPLLFGGPYRMGTARYIDGMAWPSLLVPWRGAGDARVCRVSASGSFGSNLGPPLRALPAPWWGMVPPGPDVLRGMLWRGYRDAEAMLGGGAPGASSPLRRVCGGPEAVCGGRKPGTLGQGDEIDALVATYEATARRHWMGLIAVFVAATVGALAARWQ